MFYVEQSICVYAEELSEGIGTIRVLFETIQTICTFSSLISFFLFFSFLHIEQQVKYSTNEPNIGPRRMLW